jgi:branched-chain amino acid transport system substrate-binding protein
VGGALLVRDKKGGEESRVIKIGIASLMSGDFAVVGENIRNTAQLVVDEINEKGGVNGRKLELIIEDSKCDSKTGLSAVSKLINIDKVKYIIGAMCSNGTVASAPIANENKVIIMTPITGGRSVDEAGEYIFRMANSDVLAGVDTARAMIGLGYTKIAIATELTEYNQDVKNGFLNEIKKLGGNVVVDEDFNPNTTDFKTLIAKIKNSDVQTVAIWSQTGISGAHFVKQLKEQNVNLPIFSDFNFVLNPDAKKIVGNFEGIYFADPNYDSDGSDLKSFFTKFETKYNIKPSVPFHTASTYDSIKILVSGIENVGDDSVKVKNWILQNIKGYNGFMGKYSLDEKGNSDLGFTIKVVKNGEYVKIR